MNLLKNFTALELIEELEVRLNNVNNNYHEILKPYVEEFNKLKENGETEKAWSITEEHDVKQMLERQEEINNLKHNLTDYYNFFVFQYDYVENPEISYKVENDQYVLSDKEILSLIDERRSVLNAKLYHYTEVVKKSVATMDRLDKTKETRDLSSKEQEEWEKARHDFEFASVEQNSCHNLLCELNLFAINYDWEKEKKEQKNTLKESAQKKMR